MNYQFKKLLFTSFLFSVLSHFGCQRSDEVYDVVVPNKVSGVLDVAMKKFSANSDTLNYIFIDNVSHSQIKIEASVDNNNHLKSILYYKDGAEWVAMNNFDINLQNAAYKKMVNKAVKDQAEKIKSSFNSPDLSDLVRSGYTGYNTL